MTWVLGTTSPFGFGAMISDVSVSWPGSEIEQDLIQKAFCVGPFLLAGFSGSVKIGYELVEDLRSFLRRPPKGAWEPIWVAKNWSSRAVNVFANNHENERHCGSSVLIVGVSPNNHLGLPEFPRTYIIKLKSPTFVPQITPVALAFDHIGSGSSLSLHIEAVKQLFGVNSPYMGELFQISLTGAVPFAQSVAYHMRQAIERQRAPGISQHLHIHTCHRGQYTFSTNDGVLLLPDGQQAEFRMPTAAASFEEFRDLCSDMNLPAASAIA